MKLAFTWGSAFARCHGLANLCTELLRCVPALVLRLHGGSILLVAIAVVEDGCIFIAVDGRDGLIVLEGELDDVSTHLTEGLASC